MLNKRCMWERENENQKIDTSDKNSGSQRKDN